MNLIEKKMVDLLKELKNEHNVTGVKSEFEAEGTRMEEAMRLKEISLSAGLEMTIKVGGCEALTNMFEAAAIGCSHLVGPMIESPYAFHKFVQSFKTVFSEEQRKDMDFLINIETITAFNNLDAMLALPEAKELDGIVIGRVDFTGSLNLTREDINSDRVLDYSLQIAKKAKAKDMTVVVGGGVSVHSLPFFKKFPAGHLDRFETRKVVFNCPGALKNEAASFLKAVEFEICWLKNKKDYYGRIHKEDDIRLKMMEERYQSSIEGLSNVRQLKKAS